MTAVMRASLTLACILIGTTSLLAQQTQKVPAGFVSLFDGQSFKNWKVPDGDNGHWKIVDGVFDHDNAI